MYGAILFRDFFLIAFRNLHSRSSHLNTETNRSNDTRSAFIFALLRLFGLELPVTTLTETEVQTKRHHSNFPHLCWICESVPVEVFRLPTPPVPTEVGSTQSER